MIFRPKPNFDLYPELGWPTRGESKSHPLAVSMMGPFSSYYKDRDAPILGEEDGAEKDTEEGEEDTAADAESAEAEGLWTPRKHHRDLARAQ